MRPPALILAADHRARGVMTVEPYADYLACLGAALPHCDGVLASFQPLSDLVATGAVAAGQLTYLSVNRTGLAGSAFELDDRLVAGVARAAEEGWTGIKHMTRIDLGDPISAAALELLGQVLEDCRVAGVEAFIEAAIWRDGAMARDPSDIVLAAAIVHDLGAPLLKVPVPDVPSGPARSAAVERVVASVGVPVLFLGGPALRDADEQILDEVRDCMAGGAAGMAMGRNLYQHPSPADMAKRVAEVVHGR
jgi:DhnA family fructose-bisphosphate aldolase class Ia